MKMKDGSGARQGAARLIDRVTLEGMPLEEGAPELAGLAAPDRAEALRLARSTLRHLGRADAVLDGLLRKKPPAPVRNLLRLGATEILAEGSPPHGVGNALVEIARSGGRRMAPYAGLVNAVMRKVPATRPVWEKAGPTRLPPWLSGRVRKAFGRAAVRRIEAAHERGAPLDITPHPREDVAALARILGGDVLPTGSIRLRGKGRITELPGYDAGRWWVQDAAAALPARLAGDVAGRRVLDLCAAPGGKTMQLAAAGADVTAVDISERRLARLAENLARIGTKAEIVATDALDFTAETPFDMVLLDAPCTATGTIRRHPDLPFVRGEADVPPLVDLQRRLGRRAASLVAPGGRLVLSTCSLLPEEGEAWADAFVAEHPDWRPVPLDLEALGLDPAWSPAPGRIRLRPDYWAERGGMDGFFIAVFEKPVS